MTNTKRDELPDCPLFSEIVNQLCDHQELIDLSLRQLKDICLRHTARPSADLPSVEEILKVMRSCRRPENGNDYLEPLQAQAIHQAMSGCDMKIGGYCSACIVKGVHHLNSEPCPTNPGEGEAVELAKMVVRFKRGECALPNMCGAAEEFLSKHNSK